jgi:hypothetical protein
MGGNIWRYSTSGASGTDIFFLSFTAGLASLYLPDCNVRTANNTSPTPTLLKDAAIETNKTMLIRITAHVHGVAHRCPCRHLADLASW